MTQDTIQEQIAQFFSNGSHFRLDLLKKFISKLIEFQKAAQNETRYRFYSTSLLLLYEGEFDDVSAKKETPIDVRMIDFAHTYSLLKEEEQDDGYLFGLQNFINILQAISKELQEKKTTPLTERLRIIDA